ncbi:MAG: hypothetical protein ACFB9M_15705 [Myxococcota bacterium]
MRWDLLPNVLQNGTGRVFEFITIQMQERGFLIFMGISFLLVGIIYPDPTLAMWVGFAFAGYAATANDSIQTIGTFLASNQHRPWWLLWFYIASLFLVTVGLSWLANDGDVTWGVLQSKGFSEQPQEFDFLQVAAPLFLIILTRLRMPVSTTFLLLSAFATKVAGIEGVLIKSLSGYVIAFVSSIVLWGTLGRFMHRRFVGEPHPAWWPTQWIVSGLLWCLWVSQDAANIAVFLPRFMSFFQFVGFASVIVAGLGLLFLLKGDRIQTIVNEKSSIYDVRAATVIDFLYAIILFVFKIVNNVPMSTTWVFIGLLGGRELAYAWSVGERRFLDAFRMMGRDILFAFIGLLVSLVLAASINDDLRQRIFGF